MRSLKARDRWCLGAGAKHAALEGLGELASPPSRLLGLASNYLRDEIQAELLAAGALPVLVRLLGHSSSDMQCGAVGVLHKLMRGSEPNKSDIVAAGAVPALVRLVGQHSKGFCQAQVDAAEALHTLVTGSGVPIKAAVAAADDAVPALVQAMGRGQYLLAMHAGETLRHLAIGGEPMKAAVAAAAPALVQLLTSNSEPLSMARVAASRVLLALTASGGSSPPHQLMKDPAAAASALVALVRLVGVKKLVNPSERDSASEAALAVLRNLAASGDPSPAASAANGSSLDDASPVTAGTAMRLVQLLGDSRSDVQRAAAIILGNLAAGSKAQRAAVAATSAGPALEKLLDHSNSDVQSAAAAALRSMAAASQDPQPAEQAAPPEQAQQQSTLHQAAGQALPANASRLLSGPSAPPAPDWLLSMLQPAQGQQGTGPGSNGSRPPPPQSFTDGIRCRIVQFEALQRQRHLGAGGFGQVFLATLEETLVAAKLLVKLENGVAVTPSASQLRRLQRECSIMASITHPNVVQFLGACEWPPTIVMEYCERGSMRDVLQAASSSPQQAALLSWTRRISMALDAAKGILHMHGRHVVHRDLKSLNLLVTVAWRVKVADFGFSKPLDTDAAGVMSSTLDQGGTPQWQAPEVLRGELGAPKASDVYAFGVILWELMTWQQPWEGFNKFHVMVLKMGGSRLDVPSSPQALAQLPGTDRDRAAFQRVDAQYIELIKQCWRPNQRDRPDFASIVQQLKQIQAALRAQ